VSHCIAYIPMEYDYGFIPYTFTFKVVSQKAKVLDVIKVTDTGPSCRQSMALVVRDEFVEGTELQGSEVQVLVVPIVVALTKIPTNAGRYIATVQNGAWRYLFFEITEPSQLSTENARLPARPAGKSAGTAVPSALSQRVVGTSPQSGGPVAKT
jgi:hypothetical protein